MAKKDLVSVVLIIMVVILLTVFAFAVRIAPQADRVAVLKTAGIAGGGCATQVAEALRGARGIAAVEAEVATDGGRVIVGYDSGKTGPEAIASAVAASGYRAEVAQLLDIERYRKLTGKYPGKGADCGGCGCGIGRSKRSGQ